MKLSFIATILAASFSAANAAQCSTPCVSQFQVLPAAGTKGVRRGHAWRSQVQSRSDSSCLRQDWQQGYVFFQVYRTGQSRAQQEGLERTRLVRNSGLILWP